VAGIRPARAPRSHHHHHHRRRRRRAALDPANRERSSLPARRTQRRSKPKRRPHVRAGDPRARVVVKDRVPTIDAYALLDPGIRIWDGIARCHRPQSGGGEQPAWSCRAHHAASAAVQGGGRRRRPGGGREILSLFVSRRSGSLVFVLTELGTKRLLPLRIGCP
jgi:hypothetical protein